MKGKKLIKRKEVTISYRPIGHMTSFLEKLIRFLGAGLTKGEGDRPQKLEIISKDKE
jgi:hypothetical protein